MKTKRVLAAIAMLALVVFTSSASFAETKAADAAAYTDTTVSDAFVKKDALAGKKVAVKGKVVKVSNGIMGTNWYHIKDGTGSAGTDDLIVTSDDVAKAGDEVVARGELSKDVDFGAGYKYAVIIKGGKVSAK